MSEEAPNSQNDNPGQGPDQVAANHDWHESAPDWLKDMPYFRPTEDGQFRPLNEVTESLKNAAKLQGNISESHIRRVANDMSDDDKAALRNEAMKEYGLIAPPDPENAEAMRKHYQGLGMPEEASGYKAPDIEDFELQSDTLEQLREFAHANNWSQGQFDAYVNHLAEESRAGAAERSTWSTRQQEILKEKLGDAASQRIDMIAAAIGESAPEGFLDNLKGGKVDAQVVLMLDGLVQNMLSMGDESNEFVRQMNAAPRAMTPDEYRSKADELWEELQDMNQSNPEYDKKNAKRLEYISLANKG